MRATIPVLLPLSLLLALPSCFPEEREEICLYHTDCLPCYRCDNGSCALDEEQLNACGGCGEVREVCDNGADDDCDGETDEGCGDPCAAVTCDSAPAPECLDGETLRVHTAPGTCAGGICSYPHQDVVCPGGCAADDCVGDACAGVTCDEPPDACHAADGTCSHGVCSYPPLADGAPCDDGDDCTATDACAAGTCRGQALTCEDPPPPECRPDGVTRRVYDAVGTCSGGDCSYGATDTPCPERCLAGECATASADLEATPASYDFGDLGVGCGGAEVEITIRNVGSAAVTVVDVRLDPDHESFTLLAGGSVPFTLGAGSSLPIRVRFQPLSPGAHATNLVLGLEGGDTHWVPLDGDGVDPYAIEVWSAPDPLMVDVLFVVENSGSMGSRMDALAAASAEFLGRAAELPVDYHIGVLSTEVNDAETGMGTPPRDILPGVLVQAPGRPKVIDGGTTDAVGALEDNLNLGDCCSDEQEAPLQAAYLALTEPFVSDPARNAGFLRAGARLVVIDLGDEDDQSDLEVGTYTDALQAIQGSGGGDWMMISAVNRLLQDDCPDGPVPSVRLAEAVDSTDGLFLSICAPSYGPLFAALADHAFQPVHFYALSAVPAAGTIAVAVDGLPVPEASAAYAADGWTYEGDANALWFGDDVVPAPGALIEVRHSPTCD